MRIARFDPRTRTVLTSRLLTGAGDMALAGGLLWVSGFVPRSGGTRGLLYGLSPRNLSVDRVIALPGRPGPLAASPAGLWVGGVRRLYRIDTDTGGTLASVRVRGATVRLAVDPSGDVLYVGRTRPGFADGLPPQERDAVSGALLATSSFNLGYGPTWLAATDEGVWYSSPTGNFGAAFFLEERGLTPRGNSIEADQGVRASLAGGWLWIPQDLGRKLTCADPVTGAGAAMFTLGRRAAGGYEDETNVVTVGRSTFVGTGAGIVRIPASECAP